VKVRRCLICSQTLEPGVYALDRPGPLVRFPLDDVGALSPDGRRAVGTYLPVAGQDSPSGLIRLVDVQAGRVLHTFDLRRIGRSTTPVSGRGAWRGDELVVPVSVGFTRLLVFFRAGERLSVTGTIHVPRGTLPVRFAVSLHPPQYVGAGTRRVVTGISGERIGGGYTAAVLTCDRDARSCVRGRLVPPRRWFAVLANPSRP
jgi:hypothetical protein